VGRPSTQNELRVRMQTVEAVQTLMMFAEKAAAAPLDTVTSKRITPPSGDKRDFVSLNMFAWPSSNSTQHSQGPWVLQPGIPFSGVCLDSAHPFFVLPVLVALHSCQLRCFVCAALLDCADPIAAQNGSQHVDECACLSVSTLRERTQHVSDSVHAACRSLHTFPARTMPPPPPRMSRHDRAMSWMVRSS
jgi:hypothetical protein